MSNYVIGERVKLRFGDTVIYRAGTVVDRKLQDDIFSALRYNYTVLMDRLPGDRYHTRYHVEDYNIIPLTPMEEELALATTD